MINADSDNIRTQAATLNCPLGFTIVQSSSSWAAAAASSAAVAAAAAAAAAAAFSRQ